MVNCLRCGKKIEEYEGGRVYAGVEIGWVPVNETYCRSCYEFMKRRKPEIFAD